MKKRKKITGLLLGMLLLLLTACGSSETTETQPGAGLGVIEETEAAWAEGGELSSTEETAELAFLEEQAASMEAEEKAAASVIQMKAEQDGLLKAQSRPSLSEKAAEMQVHFLDVGQGDATLILCDGEAMLIDAGDDSQGTAVQNYLKKRGVSRLNYLVLTHTDADHIGGSDVIISKFQVDNVFIGDFPKESRVYRDLMDALAYRGYPWSTPGVGSTYTLGTARITILAPNKTYDDPNDCSIALLVENGEDSFLFTGDAEERAEADILANGLLADCDVFKAGHHGSKTSNSTAFLKAASPEMVVISCGEGNSYGHPHAATLNTLRSMGVEVYRTDEQGSVVATSTGKGITWNTAPSDTWQAGEPKGSSAQTGKTGASETKQTNAGGSTSATSSGQSSTSGSSGRDNGQAASSASQAPVSAAEAAPAVSESVPESVAASAASEAVLESAAAAEPAPVAEPATGTLVWKSATGEKYHSINNCGRMNPAKATQITKEQAESMGLEPCSKCY